MILEKVKGKESMDLYKLATDEEREREEMCRWAASMGLCSHE